MTQRAGSVNCKREHFKCVPKFKIIHTSYFKSYFTHKIKLLIKLIKIR